jgi:hypothetical protein
MKSVMPLGSSGAGAILTSPHLSSYIVPTGVEFSGFSILYHNNSLSTGGLLKGYVTMCPDLEPLPRVIR